MWLKSLYQKKRFKSGTNMDKYFTIYNRQKYISCTREKLFIIISGNYLMYSFYCRFLLLDLLHRIIIVVSGGGRVLLSLHCTLGCPHCCLLGCLLHMWILPRTCRPFLLSLAHASSTTTVEVVHLHTTQMLDNFRQTIQTNQHK